MTALAGLWRLDGNPDATAYTRVSEPGLAARLSRNARAQAQQFDWSVILPRWKALLLRASAGTLGSIVGRPMTGSVMPGCVTARFSTLAMPKSINLTTPDAFL